MESSFQRPPQKIRKKDKGDYVNERQNGALAKKVIRSTFWVAASTIFAKGLYFLRTIILIRLLNPIDFGLMGIAMVVFNVLERFSETGIGMALVQKKEVDKSTLNTAWIMTVMRGGMLFILLCLFSPLVSRFYDNERLNLILRIVSFSFLFNGLASAGIFLFVKELNFKNKVIFEQSNAVANAVVSITLAVIFKNVWALVAGYIAGTIVASLLSYKLHAFRPSLKVDLNAVKGLLNFGKYVFATGIAAFFVMQGPDALVGKVLGLDILGFYVVSFGIANMPTTSITHLVSQIAFPAYAKLQDDMPRLRDGYLKVTRLVAFLSALLAGGIFMLIPEFVQVFLGVKWMPIILPVRILCIFGFFRSIASTVSPVFYAMGRPDLEFKLVCLNLTLLAILIYPFTVKMGITGTSIAFAIVSSVYISFMMRLVYKLIRLDAAKTQFFKALLFPLGGMALMCLAMYLLKSVFSHSLIMAFSASILIGGGLYILALYLLDKYFGYGLIDTIRFAVISYKSQ